MTRWNTLIGSCIRCIKIDYYFRFAAAVKYQRYINNASRQKSYLPFPLDNLQIR